MAHERLRFIKWDPQVVNKQLKVAIVTPVFNGKDHTTEFLSALRKQTYHNFKIVIVDDGSTDGTSEMIEDDFPEVQLLKGDGSLWWSGGTNLGVEFALENNFDYILTINNDVIVANNYIESLVEVAKEHPRALIGSKVCYLDNTKRVWYCGATFNQRNGQMEHRTGYDKDFKSTQSSEWLTGMGVLVPAETYMKVGLYSNDFPLYFGDADFSVRAKKAGYALIVSAESRVYADITSAWIMKQIRNPKLSFLWQLFTSIRSPYQIKSRYKFYHKYWPKNFHLALLKLYTVGLKGVYRGFTISYLKKLLGIKSLRSLIGRKS